MIRPRMLMALAPTGAAMLPLSPVGAAAPEYLCNGTVYDAADPTHVLDGAGTEHGMWVDLAMAAAGQTVFFSGVGHSDSDGAVIYGSSFDDVTCGTDADDSMFGRRGDDLIFGEGSSTDYGDTLFGNGGDDTIDNGGFDGREPNPVTAAPSLRPAAISGGRGDDTIYPGHAADIVKAGRGADTFNPRHFGRGEGAVVDLGSGRDTVIMPEPVVAAGERAGGREGPPGPVVSRRGV